MYITIVHGQTERQASVATGQGRGLRCTRSAYELSTRTLRIPLIRETHHAPNLALSIPVGDTERDGSQNRPDNWDPLRQWREGTGEQHPECHTSAQPSTVRRRLRTTSAILSGGQSARHSHWYGRNFPSRVMRTLSPAGSGTRSTAARKLIPLMIPSPNSSWISALNAGP